MPNRKGILNKMKKLYTKPMAVFETYELNASIASGCTNVVNLGPGDAIHDMCSDYDDAWEISLFAWEEGDHMQGMQTNFYPESCDCYLDAGEGLMFIII